MNLNQGDGMFTYEHPLVVSENLLQKPTYAFDAGAALVENLGIKVNPRKDPGEYYKQVRAANPRSDENKTRDDIPDVNPDDSEEDILLKGYTANQLGLMAREYPFNNHRVSDVIVIPAKPAAWEARAVAALEALKDEKKLQLTGGLWVPGSTHKLSEADVASVKDWAPGVVTEADLAVRLVARLRARYEDELTTASATLGTFAVDNPDAKTEHYTAEFIDERRKEGHPIGKLAVVAQAIYVPFMTYKNLAAAQPRGVDVVTVGIPSSQKIIKGRGPETYFKDTLPVLTSAAKFYEMTEASKK